MACAIPDTQLTAAEKQCCKEMGGDCGQDASGMPMSHSCCKTSVQPPHNFRPSSTFSSSAPYLVISAVSFFLSHLRRAARPINFLAVAGTLASTWDARRSRSPENLALLSIPVWNYALVSLLKCSSLEESCGISTHRFDNRSPFSGLRARADSGVSLGEATMIDRVMSFRCETSFLVVIALDWNCGLGSVGNAPRSY